jgi:probable phosphoglycerate mutase
VIERVLGAAGGGDDDGAVALFSHGHFLRVLGARWAGWPVEAGLHLLLDTGTLSELGDKRGDRVIRSWNAAVSA